mmetsp:Transcript_8423/g.14101  ORF Transcript_8423/g.14101 Transcript_8423/m.14101 type:complete len:181 (+) Transcript_8423:512-1054(+)
MDFRTMKMASVEYLNDDSTGTVRGEETDKRGTFLPLSLRVNYSLCSFKNKVYIYGGISEQSQVLATMEVFECANYKFNPVKYRGDHTPLARQGHSAHVLNQYSMLVLGGSYEQNLLTPPPLPENDMVWSYDLESGQWQRIQTKARSGGDHAVPWNLVHHVSLKLDEFNLCVLWQDDSVLG